MIIDILLISIFSLLCTWITTPLVRTLALRHHIGDYPSERKIHSRFIPRMGGIGIMIGFAGGVGLACVLNHAEVQQGLANLWGVILGIVLVTTLGMYDDIKGIGSFGKLVVQSVAAGIVILSGLRVDSVNIPFMYTVHLGIMSFPVTFLWIVGITNAFNLLDGLDGLAAGVAAIASATFFFLALSQSDNALLFTTAAFSFACIGFLRYNFHPASIFMGDTGSLFIGFVLACISLRVVQHVSNDGMGIVSFSVVIALAVPIADTSVAFFRRINRGMHPLKADKEHIHHRLMDLGLTHRQTVVIHYGIAMLSGFTAFLVSVVDAFYAIILLVIVIAMVLLSIWRLGYIEEMTFQKKEEAPPIRPLSIARIIDKGVLVTADLTAILLSFLTTYWFRFHSGLFIPAEPIPLELYFRSPALLLLAGLWLALFALAGLYEIPWDASRIDYGFSILKAVSVGTITVFLVTLDPASTTIQGRVTTLFYGISVAFFAILVRMLVVSFERKHEILGYRRRGTLVVGTSESARNLLTDIKQNAGLKYNVVGFIDRDRQKGEFLNLPVLGTADDIPAVVRKYNIEEILISSTYDSREEILDIVTQCNGIVQSVKAVPESVDFLTGFRTEEIVGHPLIRLYPTNMKHWQWIVKRTIDIVVSMIILVPFLPVWVLIGVVLKIDSAGPIFFIQERVGKKGKIFRLYKFRSMVLDAEKETGPVWASPGDQRITRLGRTLRRLRIDEVPQFINVLKGEMSLVGPRPERPFFVNKLNREVKFYSRRLLVRPGITGWAQVKHRYDTSLEDVKEKIKYDLYYLENMSLMLDFKILLRTIIVALSGKGTH